MSDSVPVSATAAPAPASVIARVRAFVVDVEHDAAVALLNAGKEAKALELEAETDLEALFARIRAAV